jgi:hypothetical protein
VVAVALLLDSTRTVLHSTWHDRKLMESSFVTPDCTEDAVLRRASGGTVRLDPDFVPTALNPGVGGTERWGLTLEGAATASSPKSNSNAYYETCSP